MRDRYLGEFEEFILLAILGLPEERTYAVPIQHRIATQAGRETTLGSVYRTLSRLEKKGYVRSWMGDVTHEQGGKRKRLYAVTGIGEAALLALHQARTRLWDGVALKPKLGAS